LPRFAPEPGSVSRMSLTKRFVEQRIQKARNDEAKAGEMRRMLTTHNLLAGHARSEKVVEGLRRSRSQAAERRDLFMEYSHVRGEQEKERRRLIGEAEDRLAIEIAKKNADKQRKEQDRQRVCDGSEELRALKERLHAAKVNKERAQQLFEIEKKKEKERRMDHILAEHFENERLEHIELEHKLELEKMKQRERVKTINQQQIVMKEAQREQAMFEYMNEKVQVEELVDRIAREDAEEQAARNKKKEESKEMLIKFKVEQAQRQKDLEQAEFDENQKIAQYAADKAAREEKLAQEKALLEKEKERIALQIREQVGMKNKEKEELEFLRNELHEEEHEAEARRREELQQRKKLEDKEEMRRASELQAQQRDLKRAKFLEEEAKMRDILLAKFAEDDRIEQLAEHKRRMKVEAHKREAARLIEMRREAYLAQREAERDEELRLRDGESDRQAIISEERERLLKEHAIPLRDFLPKGTLATKEDYDYVFSQ